MHAYFDDLRDTINRQEEAGLAVVNNYVREKLLSLRQQQEDMAVLISQVAAVCTECERALQKTDAEVGWVANTLQTLQWVTCCTGLLGRPGVCELFIVNYSKKMSNENILIF